ncbi:THAP domain-containing protein 3 isoform X2 [Hippopotamus amphibius kiboko]|uniref:THAP domain-containing protein 3 isoform X2 n=1 Tax=Hippopotamus amphibius kiboko TaxID=575201 RepID=UPI0025968A96|nr:THAP domain-containing protein 3 isoform X2 [Hippopotamus amphibius kiboko]
MPKSCAARQCCNRYSNRRKQLTFHRFPFSRPELLKEWVLNIGRGDFEPKQHTVICSEHFRPECFSAFGNRKNLKHNAVPTVFAFQGPPQLVRENRDPADQSGDATSEKGKVLPETGAKECGPGRKAGTMLEALQLPPDAGGPGAQVPPHRPEATGVPGQPASPTTGLRRPLPTQPSDHSYALLDLDALKKKLFLTLKENEKLRRRLKAQRLVMRRMSSRFRARSVRQPGLQAGPRPELQS